MISMIEMAEPSALNSVVEVVKNASVASKAEKNIKQEEVKVKPEPQECAVCAARSADTLDVYEARTACGTLLSNFLCKFTHSELVATSSKHVCKSCFDLIDVLEQAELEYFKLKESFEAIISKNPLFDSSSQQTVVPVKCEVSEVVKADSDDEPLAVTKTKRRKVVTRKKKVPTTAKRKPQVKKRFSRIQALPATLTREIAVLPSVKQEDSQDGSESSQCNMLESVFKLELDPEDDSSYCPDGDSEPEPPRRAKPGKKTKTVHQCDQCDAKYTSLKRLEAHREKHLGALPPYICEVCGARYKHKRACDIHVALHKGISDWKCEECNKLFPSKGALQRHNNIHTGKLNYQCDLCGKSFIHTSSFKMHKLSHSGVKPHACDVCGLALMTRSHLKRHKRVHSGEKRHECPVCGKRFSERYNLVAHSKMHESAGEAPAVAAPRRRLFRCPYCADRFERRYMLERHVSVSHGRTLERLPATPRNTMSKLLKAQAQAGRHGAATPADVTVTKEERSPESTASSVQTHKIQLSPPGAGIAVQSWSGAYAAEFGLRPDYTH